MNRQGIVWLIIAAMLCVSVCPPVGLCFCTDCSCPGSVLQWAEGCSESCGNCCHLATPGQAVPCECRCADGTGMGIMTIRLAIPSFGDGVKSKKSFDWPTWKVTKDTATWMVDPIISRCQLAPHIQLPRIHLLLSVFLN